MNGSDLVNAEEALAASSAGWVAGRPDCGFRPLRVWEEPSVRGAIHIETLLTTVGDSMTSSGNQVLDFVAEAFAGFVDRDHSSRLRTLFQYPRRVSGALQVQLADYKSFHGEYVYDPRDVGPRGPIARSRYEHLRADQHVAVASEDDEIHGKRVQLSQAIESGEKGFGTFIVLDSGSEAFYFNEWGNYVLLRRG